MGYEVKIKPGKSSQIKPENLDKVLKDGCEKVLQLGTNIYVYGENGCGKSSVLNYLNYALPEKLGIEKNEILLLTADDFVDAVINGIRNSKLDEFHENMKQKKVLIIDDIDIFEGKETTQKEFLRLLNMKKLIILSGSSDVENLRLVKKIKEKIKNYTAMELSEIEHGCEAGLV